MGAGFSAALEGQTCDIIVSKRQRTLDDWGMITNTPEDFETLQGFISYKEDNSLSINDNGSQGVDIFDVIIPGDFTLKIMDIAKIEDEFHDLRKVRYDRRACVTRLEARRVTRRALDVTP